MLRLGRPSGVGGRRAGACVQSADRDVELGRPAAVGLDPDLEGQARVSSTSAGAVAEIDRRAPERLAPVAEHAAGRPRPGVEYVPFFCERVLDLEQVGEVGAGLDPDREVDAARRRG